MQSGDTGTRWKLLPLLVPDLESWGFLERGFAERLEQVNPFLMCQPTASSSCRITGMRAIPCLIASIFKTGIKLELSWKAVTGMTELKVFLTQLKHAKHLPMKVD